MELKKTSNQLATKKGMSATDWVTVVIGALYVVSPVDFIPDAIPIAGWMDDLLVGLTSLTTVVNAQLSQGNMLLSGLLKTVKWISFALFAILGMLALLFGAVIYQIFS